MTHQNQIYPLISPALPARIRHHCPDPNHFLHCCIRDASLTPASPSVDAIVLRNIVVYGRVATHSQKADLDVQCNFLLEKYPTAEVIKEVGSGLNFKRRKFLQLMNRVAHHEIDEIVIGYKNRLCRFGFDFVEWFCDFNHCQINVLGQTDLSAYQELMQDFMSIMHCFSSRLYFLRRYKKEIQNDPDEQQVEQCH